MFHRLNRAYLPENKEIRIIGYAEKGESPYKTIGPADIDGQMDFEFTATMLNTNKQMLAQQMQFIAAMCVSPIAIQLGIVTPDEIYRILRKSVQSQDQDPDEFLKRPMSALMGPKMTAEDAITAILDHKAPVGQPIEQPQMHLEKIIEFIRSPDAKILDPLQSSLLAQYYQQVMQMVQIQMQQQMMMAQAAGGGQQGQGGKEGPGGAPSDMTPPGPESQTKVGMNEQMDGSLPI